MRYTLIDEKRSVTFGRESNFPDDFSDKRKEQGEPVGELNTR